MMKGARSRLRMTVRSPAAGVHGQWWLGSAEECRVPVSAMELIRACEEQMRPLQVYIYTETFAGMHIYTTPLRIYIHASIHKYT
jgi:hypothetical protein